MSGTQFETVLNDSLNVTAVNAGLYLALARLGFRRQFAYLQAALWGLVTNLFFGLLRISILLALFDGRPQVAGMTGGDVRGADADVYRGVFAIRVSGAAADPITQVTALAPVRDITVKEPEVEATIRRIYEGGLLRRAD